ncbi:MAG TPA: hypothetical protein VGC14_02080 [Rhizobium sp.]
MGSLINQPLLALDFLACPKAIYDVVGGGIDGGRNGVGESQSIELSGGGLVTATLEDCKIVSKEQLRYINKLGARLNGSFRNIIVPIPTDWHGPFPTIGKLPTPIVRGIPHSDGSLFSDDSGYSQATVWGTVLSGAALNAGQISIRVYDASRDIDGDWFSIEHSVKGWRAYRDWEIVKTASGTQDVSGYNRTYSDYIASIQPPLRQAVTAGARVEFARPRFIAKFKSDFTLPSVIEAFFVTEQTIQFSEAF